MASSVPLPVRNGVNPTRLRVPVTGPWSTIAEHVVERFGHVDSAGLLERFRNGEVRAADGTAVTETTPLGRYEFIWYYRSVPVEPAIPFQITVLHEDEHLLVVDKPHFVPTTPGGRFLQESALVKLRNRIGNPELVPLHRLDRATAGVLLFSTNPATRGAYQTMFENRVIGKEYEAVCAIVPEHRDQLSRRFPLVYRNRIEKTRGVITATVESYPVSDSGRLPAPRTGRQRRSHAPTTGPNAETRIDLLATAHDVAHLRLTPHTGRTHQLRVHLASLGLGILNDPFYPELLPPAEDDYSRPLQLLARSLTMSDPLTGQIRQFQSQLQLSAAPHHGTKTTAESEADGV